MLDARTRGLTQSSGMRDPQALRDLAAAQSGLVSSRQIRAAGLSRAAQQRRLASGLWRAQLGAIRILDTGTPDSQDAWALHLSCEVPLLVSGTTALALRGWSIPWRRLVVRSRAHVRIAGVALVRREHLDLLRSPEPALASPDLALIDCLRFLSPGEATALLDFALQHSWTTPDRFRELVAAESRLSRPESDWLHTLVDRVMNGAQSDGERHMHTILLRTSRTDWIGNYVVRRSDGHIIARCDFALPDLKLAVEVDGRTAHTGRTAFERDRRRQNALILAGWTVLRFTWQQITTSPDEVLLTVTQALASRCQNDTENRAF
jgi:very-short-patch-repair endonuclease